MDSGGAGASRPSGFSSSFLRRQRDEGLPSNSAKLPSTSLPSLEASSSSVPPGHSQSPITTGPSSSVRRKPLPPNASPVTRSRPTSKLGSISAAAVRAWPSSGLSSPPAPVQEPSVFYSTATVQRQSREEPFPFAVRDLDKFPRGQSPLVPSSENNPSNVFPALGREKKHSLLRISNGSYSNRPNHARLSSEPQVSSSSPSKSSRTHAQNEHKRSVTMALHPPLSRPPPPLRVDSSFRSGSSGSIDAKQPKTPGSKITSFFGWKSTSSPGAESSSTEISDTNAPSPLPSPMVPSTQQSMSSIRSIPAAIDTSKANNAIKTPSLAPPISVSPDMTSKLGQLESELREISSELAGSIRREMELEDLVERLQLDSNVATDANRRTSDYFSDSGTSSVKYPLTESGGKVEDIERVKRASEQERAQLKVDLSQKWQEERSRRTAFESHVQLLEGQVQQFRRERVDASNLGAKVKELESSLDDTRRRLVEERQLKDNFEDLLTAMRVELEQHRNEKDTLRDETLPQIQQELQALRNENATLAQGRKLHGDQSRFNSIAEEGDLVNRRTSVGLSRSNSLARMPMRSNGLGGSLSRSNSVTGKDRESRESLADRMKDVEMQRDALHRAVKSLLDRQAYQTRENEKRIRMLELELDRARQSGSPRRLGYEREVQTLREEINHLRRRADDALEQKWQCEKGLGGLKMDLDRAEQETGSLRTLLQEHDIPAPDTSAMSQGLADVQATSSSLEDSYKQLQADRDYAEANPARSLEEEQMLANQLGASVGRTEALAAQVRQQLDTNSSLRNRLADTIGKGEREQKLSAIRISEMQSKLKNLEDTLMVAQHHSEEEVCKHEDELQTLKESHNAQLQRAKNGIRSPVALSPYPASPFSATRSPRLDKTTTGDGIALNEAVRTVNLESKVKELEKALRDADMGMEEVVERMNRAQIEVAELQTDRDEALRQTRKLQAEILAERENFKAMRG